MPLKRFACFLPYWKVTSNRNENLCCHDFSRLKVVIRLAFDCKTLPVFRGTLSRFILYFLSRKFNPVYHEYDDSGLLYCSGY